MGVFLYDLIRTTRRSRLVLLRGFYALILLVALCGVYVRWFPGRLTVAELFAPGPALSPRDLAQFAHHFVMTCLFVQFGAMLLLTPATVAGAIAEERQRGTLDLLLTSDLTAREIVAGKWFARGLFLIGVLLTGLPVLALTFLFGGVEPRLLLACFALTVSSLASLIGLSLYCSVRARSVIGAVTATYGLAVAFYTLTAPIPYVRIVNPCSMTAAIVRMLPGDPSWAGASYEDVMLCCGLHLAAGLILVLATGYRLRASAGPPGHRAEPLGVGLTTLPAAPSLPTHRRYTLRPPPGQDALLWKELNFSGRLVGNVFRRAGFLLGVSVFVTTFGVFGWMLFGPTLILDNLGPRLNPLFRALTVPALGFAMLGVTIAATGSVSRERERHTLDGLLCLPRGRDELLRAWWLGSVWHLGRLVGGLVGLGVIGCCLGSLHVLAFPPLLLVAAVHAGFGASLGLYLSVVARTTARAVLAATLCLLAACLLPPMAANFWDGLAGSAARSWPWIGALLWDGLSPPLTWWRLTHSAAEDIPSTTLESLLLGLAAYATLSLWLWRGPCRRFEGEGNSERHI